ncbi:hypothetical protein JAO76_07985 [Pontibacter sp. BT310]|uniref:Lipoprotein n=1 Tax=Pontibacter populi TaxID=890055 RepID=A0ABS6XAF5_9BACT|nr:MULTISPECIES: hypothetical protein [Pontibacter]MBJ6118125.1 hypothetical protein [Pontibacter sp. BT310]MBR0570552.1 hypothetical protein [Microvirga sp. STS03]MBW3364978.1 hypothetical protein [Pontibacter populi]
MNKLIFLALISTTFIYISGCGSKEIHKESKITSLKHSNNPDSVPTNVAEQSPREFMLDSDSEDVISLEIIPFIPESYKVFNFVKGDLNGDALEDYIISLVNPKYLDEELEEYSENTKLPTLFLLRQRNGHLQLKHKTNEFFGLENVDNSITSSAEILIDGNGLGFTVTYHSQGYSASGVWSEDKLHFTFSKKIGDWVLDTVTVGSGANSPSYQWERSYIDKAEEIGDTVFLKYVEENGFPYDEEVLERFIVKDSVYKGEPSSDGDGSYDVYTKRHFGFITLSKFKGTGELKGIDW